MNTKSTIEYKSDRSESTYGNLCVCRLTAAQRSGTCGYWYTVTNGATAHTAFRSRAALDLWMAERNLEFVPGEEPNLEDGYDGWGLARIRNAYTDVCHRTAATMPPDWFGEHLRVWSNGAATKAIKTVTEGHAYIHHVNVNDRSRVEYDYQETERIHRNEWNQPAPFVKLADLPLGDQVS